MPGAQRNGPRYRTFAELTIVLTTMPTLLEEFRSNYTATQDEELSLEDYLELCKREPAAYPPPPARVRSGIGEPEQVDTRNDPRLGRIFGNRVIRRYPAFREFYGME